MVAAINVNTNGLYSTRLEELGNSVTAAQNEMKSFPSFFIRRRPIQQKMAMVDLSKKAVRDMASYLALFPAKNVVTEKIKELSSSIISKKISLDSENTALLERVNVATLLRESPEKITGIKFRSKINRDLLSKWINEGFPEEAFLYNPTIASFIFQGHIHHKMKAYGETFQYDKETHEFKILVDGNYQNVAEVAEKIVAKETALLGHSSTYLVSKEDEKETWNYLPQKGLTKWKDSGWEELSPFASLNSSQVSFAQAQAKRKDGSQGQKDDYVVEILCTIHNYKERPFISGYQETFSKFRHPWIRIITPQGQFYSVGFGVGGKVDPAQPTAVVKGIFRTPDSWETMPFSEKPITGYAISQEDFMKLKEKIEGYQKKEMDFNFLEHNCSAFIEWVKDQFVPSDEKEKVSFSVDISELVKMCLPKTVQKVGKKLSPILNFVKYYCGQMAPPIAVKTTKCVIAVFRLIAERTLLTISGRWFSYRKEKEFPKNGDPHAGIPWWQFMTHVNIALEQRLIKVYLPRKVAEWQLAQPQTRVIKAGTPLFNQYEVFAELAFARKI